MRFNHIISFIISIALIINLLVSVNAVEDTSAGSVYYSGDTNEKLVALTFDDGPHKFRTPEILDVLDKYNVKATFFVVGAMAHEYKDIIKREICSGHEIGNHTYNHSKMRKLSCERLIKELDATENELYEIAEYRPKLFRPPEGYYSEQIAKAVGKIDYDIILWNIDTLDWAHNEVDKICSCIYDGIKPGSIILFHDYVVGKSPTVSALEIIIPELLSRGYKFVTVSELINNDIT